MQKTKSSLDSDIRKSVVHENPPQKTPMPGPRAEAPIEKMVKLDEKFQDHLIVEMMEYINSVRPLLETIKEKISHDTDGGFLEIEEPYELVMDMNLQEIQQLHLSFEDFAKRFHQDQYKRFEDKYGPHDLDSYMAAKSEIYEVTQ